MPIPESQLITWSHQGSIAQSSATYGSMKSVLEAKTAPYYGKNYQVFLQGSYGNDTNIYAESDVDLVIRLDDCLQSDLSALTEEEKAAYNSAFLAAEYTYADFKPDVLSVLTSQYRSAVKDGDKAIAIAASGSRRKADVIVAINYRRYFKFKSLSDSSCIEGICFFNSAGQRIANFPKQHSANLTNRHQTTSRRLKPTVRILKNMRSRMVDQGLINSDIAPSYYIECLLYNVPVDRFGPRHQDCVANVLNWYLTDANKKDLVCANEQYYLLRDGQRTCWNQADCDAFINAAIDLWNDW